MDHGELLGMALLTRPSSRRALFISPGHNISVARCLELIRSQPLRAGLPEVIYWADRLSRREARAAGQASS